MADLVRTLVTRLDDSLERHRQPDRAAGARAYMRDQFAFYGVPAPELRRIASEAAAGLPVPTEPQLVRFVKACWRRLEREWQYVACGYLRRHVGGRSPALLDTVRQFVVTKSWWDTVDSLASHTVGPLVREHPRLARTMDRWAASDDIWLARTAILHQLSFKRETDVERLFAYCTRRARDDEFFIRKAIGWALREYSKTDARAVRSYVHDHPELSRLSRTEALKWLERRRVRRGAPLA